MSWLIFFYMILGFLVVLAVVYYLYKYYLSKPVTGTLPFPPNSYMRTIGLRCPDYWIFNESSGECVNQFNIPVTDPATCYDNVDSKTKKFTPITNWPINTNEVDQVLKTRCEWIRKCGPNKNLPASWVGIDNEHC
jgi:hypothetical protein